MKITGQKVTKYYLFLSRKQRKQIPNFNDLELSVIFFLVSDDNEKLHSKYGFQFEIYIKYILNLNPIRRNIKIFLEDSSYPVRDLKNSRADADLKTILTAR